MGRLWSDGRVTPYGSFATGLMGEKGSDLDIVVCWDESGSRNGDKDEESDSIQGRYQAPAYSVQVNNAVVCCVGRLMKWHELVALGVALSIFLTSIVLQITVRLFTLSIEAAPVIKTSTVTPFQCIMAQRLAAALRRERRWVRVAKVLDRGKLPIIKVCT